MNIIFLYIFICWMMIIPKLIKSNNNIIINLINFILAPIYIPILLGSKFIT